MGIVKLINQIISDLSALKRELTLSYLSVKSLVYYGKLVMSTSNQKKSTILAPISHIFQILEHFDEVPLFDGQLYKLLDESWVKSGETWSVSDLTVNTLLKLTHDLSGSQLQEILKNSVGDLEAEEWRKKLHSYTK